MTITLNERESASYLETSKSLKEVKVALFNLQEKYNKLEDELADKASTILDLTAEIESRKVEEPIKSDKGGLREVLDMLEPRGKKVRVYTGDVMDNALDTLLQTNIKVITGSKASIRQLSTDLGFKSKLIKEAVEAHEDFFLCLGKNIPIKNKTPKVKPNTTYVVRKNKKETNE